MTVLQSHWTLGLGLKESKQGADLCVHVPTLRYDYVPVQLDKYPTRDGNPVTSFEECSPHDDRLNQLILTTNLAVPSSKLGIAFSVAANYDSSSKFKQSLSITGEIQIGLEPELKFSRPFGLMAAIVGGQCTSGIAIMSKVETIEVCKYAMDVLKLARYRFCIALVAQNNIHSIILSVLSLKEMNITSKLRFVS